MQVSARRKLQAASMVLPHNVVLPAFFVLAQLARVPSARFVLTAATNFLRFLTDRQNVDMLGTDPFLAEIKDQIAGLP
jgi:hypothetical protein